MFLQLLADATNNVTSGWEMWGLPGAVIGATFSYILFLAHAHREERREWATRADVDRKAHVDALEKIANETSAAIQEQTRAVTALHLEIKSTCGRPREAH